MKLSRFTASIMIAVTSVVAAGTSGAGATAPPADSTPDSSASTPAESMPAASMPAEATADAGSTGSEGSGAAEWEQIIPGDDCECADGSEFSFWVREADPSKVVLFLEGGGACFDEVSCAFTEDPSTTYDWNVSADDDPALQGGIFDAERDGNPFADYTIVYVPYCTGDVHLGDTTSEYSPDLTVEHNGYTNATTALTYLAETYADAAQVVVVGESAGSVAAPIYAGLTSDLLPDAQITVFADGSGAYPDDPGVITRLDALWNTSANLPDWEGASSDITEWSPPRQTINAGQHDPEIVWGRFDYAYDVVQTLFMGFLGQDTSDLQASIDANEAQIEAVGIVQHSFTVPGDGHTLVRGDEFYTTEEGGVLLTDWVAGLIGGEDVADVHCTECAVAAAPTTTG